MLFHSPYETKREKLTLGDGESALCHHVWLIKTDKKDRSKKSF